MLDCFPRFVHVHVVRVSGNAAVGLKRTELQVITMELSGRVFVCTHAGGNRVSVSQKQPCLGRVRFVAHINMYVRRPQRCVCVRELAAK